MNDVPPLKQTNTVLHEEMFEHKDEWAPYIWLKMSVKELDIRK